MIFRLLSLFLFFISLSSFSQNLSLSSLLSDNMVLQQKTEVPIWGSSFVGDWIEVKTGWGQIAYAKVDEQGNWSTRINTIEAGGPYEIIIKGGKTEIKIKNILLGEVWICSGQSNMEMTYTGWPPKDTVDRAKEEIKKIGNSKIRMFTVTKAYSIEPQNNCKGIWKEANAESLKDFSATAYYFGLKLYEKLNVPIGLINTSWGGTQVKSWTSLQTLSTYPEFNALREDFKLKNEAQSSKDKWLEKHSKIELSKSSEDKWKNLNFFDSVCATTNYSDLDWERMKLPLQWEKSKLGEFDGAVWFRKTVEIPDSWKGKELIINLPGIDDMDQTWINGVKVGATEVPGYWQTQRHYKVPASLITFNKVLVAIRVIDHQGGGGIWDTQIPMSLSLKSDSSKKVLLGENWRYLVVAEYKNNTFYLFDIKNREYHSATVNNTVGPNTATALYNAMICPLAPFIAKGFTWYQGESNVGSAEQYSSYFASMVKDWRKLWKDEGFSFYYVQIAPYKYSGVLNTESAELRNAQRVALDSVKNSGMVVTLDIGDINIIHPSKKREVGERLAYWALAKDYGINIPFSGPLYKSNTIEGNKIRIKFDYIEGGLIIKENLLNEFEIAGADKKYIPAKVTIENNTIVVSSDKIAQPLYVRYAWHNGSNATLFNMAGLPASTFTTEY
jgi:sialate O-acetylesterase